MKTPYSLPWLLLPLYLVPLGRILAFPIRRLADRSLKTPKFSAVGLRLGQSEYWLGPLRDFALTPLFFLVFAFSGLGSPLADSNKLINLGFFLFYFLISTLSLQHRERVSLRLAEAARHGSHTHPEDFFKFYYQSLGPWPPRFPISSLRPVPFHEANYQSNGKIRWTYLPLLKAVFSTSTLARMAMTAFQRVGPDYGREAFDGLARLWGLRIAQLFQMRLSVRGAEAIPPLQGKTLLLFNHQSYLDFALNFFALGMLKQSDGRRLRPRFIAAKDHFIDNPALYSWIGLGKVIENAGMVFINRQKKGQGWAAMEEAADKLSQSDIEIAIYPQGTRAVPMRSATGERRDAGYYTTFHPKNWADPLGHLKPGTAHLILDTLLKLREQGESKLNILAVGISGAATAAPRDSLRIQTESEVEFNIAPLWELSTSFADGIASPRGQGVKTPEERLYVERVAELQIQIDRHLLEALDWHRKLSQRARLEATRLSFRPEETDAISRILEEAGARQESYPFILLDRIFSLDPLLWEGFLRRFLDLRIQGAPPEVAMTLLREVSERLGRPRGQAPRQDRRSH